MIVTVWQDRPWFFVASILVAMMVSLIGGPGVAQDSDLPSEQIKLGATIYARNCSPCHGARMQDPEAAFDLRKFPHEQHERFISSVTRGKNQMPPWGDLLKFQEVEALWAYVVAGER